VQLEGAFIYIHPAFLLVSLKKIIPPFCFHPNTPQTPFNFFLNRLIIFAGVMGAGWG